MQPTTSDRTWVAYLGFAVHGGFWGTWGAAIPAVRAQATVTDGQLGTALLFVGAGAIVAMPLAGRAIDRWGRAVTAVLLAGLGLTGVLVAVAARDPVSLAGVLLAVGITSGGADVGINVAAGAAERAAGRPVVARAHGVFSVAVVLTSLATGWLLAAGVALRVPFTFLAGTAVLLAVLVVATGRRKPPAFHAGDAQQRAPAPVPARTLRRSHRRAGGSPPIRRGMVLLGVLGALAFALENAHQSWSALFLVDELSAGQAVGASGPAVFAGLVAVARFGVGVAPPVPPVRMLQAGAVLAGVGTAVLATAGTVPAALLGLGLAAVGTAVLLPTLISVVARVVPADRRGAATSLVTTVAYLGFLAGPVYVGAVADVVTLRGAMVAVSALAAVLLLAAAPVLRRVHDPSATLPVTTATVPASVGGAIVQPVIEVEDPRADDVRALVRRHLAFAHTWSPPEHCHAYDDDRLAAPGLTLFGARRDDALLGIGALQHLDDEHAELKSMHVAEEARGQGIGGAMLTHLLAVARDRGYRRVSLETGSMAAFAPARALYRAAGFTPCEPFGAYTVNDYSSCMTLVLDGASGAADRAGADQPA